MGNTTPNLRAWLFRKLTLPLRQWRSLNRNVRNVVWITLLWEMGWTLYDPLLPVYLRELGASPQQLGLMFAGTSLILAFSAIPGGWLADRFERRRLMLIFWVLDTPSMLLVSLAKHWVQAIPGLALYYAAFIASPIVNAYLTDASDEQTLGTAFAATYLTFPIALLLGPALGGLIAEQFGIRTVLLLSVLFYVASSLMILRLTPQKPHKRLKTRHQLGIIRRNPQFLGFLSIAALAYLLFNLLGRFISPYLVEVGGVSLSQLGLLNTAAALGGLLITPLSGYLSDRGYPMFPIWINLGLFGISLLFIGFSQSLLMLALAFTLQGCLYAGRAAIDSMAGNFGKGSNAGIYFGVFGFVVGMAQSIAPGIGGWLYSFDALGAFSLVGILAIGIAVAAFILPRTRVLEAQPPQHPITTPLPYNPVHTIDRDTQPL